MDFLSTLQKAIVQGPERQQSEQNLLNLRIQDTKTFFIQAVTVLCQENNHGNIRQAAGAVIKGAVRFKGGPNNTMLWENVENQLQGQIKDALMNNLITKDQQARMATADSISEIATIEVPNGTWTQLIEKLSSNTGHQDLEICKAAVMTLGQICDKFKTYGIQVMDNTTIELVLTGICVGMKKESLKDIRKISLKSLKDSFAFVKGVMPNKKIRDFVIQLLMENVQSQEIDVQIEAIQCLVEFCVNLYDFLDEYIVYILQQCKPMLENDDHEICNPTIEVFSSIAEHYINKVQEYQDQARYGREQGQFTCKNIIQMIQGDLNQILLQNLFKLPQQFEEDDDLESEIQDSVIRALCNIVEAVGDDCIDTFTAFISNTIKNEKPVYREAACHSFYALLDSPSREKIINLIQPSLSEFVNLLKDGNNRVVESAAKTLSKIAENFQDTFLIRSNLVNDLQTILLALQHKPRISRHICYLVTFLGENINNFQQSPIYNYFEPIVECLYKNANRQDISVKDISLIDVSYMATLNYIHYSPNPELAKKYLQMYVQNLPQTYQIKNQTATHQQNGIFSSIHNCLLRLQHDFQQDGDVKVIYQLIKNHFNIIQDVNNDGLFVMGALATASKNKFLEIMDDFWPFLEHAINKKDEIEVQKSAIGTLADIARAIGENFKPRIDIMQKLMQMVADQTVDRDLKLQIFLAIGDIVLACNEASNKYLQGLLSMFDISFQAAIELSQSSIQDLKTYSELLKDKLVETYTCILHGINEKSTNNELFNHFPKLIQFLDYTTSQQSDPTMDYIRQALYLIMDFANYYGESTIPYLKHDCVQNMISILKRKLHITDNQNAISYAENILSQAQQSMNQQSHN